MKKTMLSRLVSALILGLLLAACSDATTPESLSVQADLPAGTVKSLKVTTPGFTNRYVRHADSLGFTEVVNSGSSDALKADASWKIVRGLADANCYSLEASNAPGSFLRHRGYRVRMEANDNSPIFRADATWCARDGLSGQGVSLESQNYPGSYLRHYNAALWLARKGGPQTFDRAENFEADVSWNTVDAWSDGGGGPTPPPPPTGERLIDQNFQNTGLGSYTIGEVRQDFPGYLYGEENAGGSEIREEGGNRFMRSRYLAGQVGPQNAGNLWAVDISDAGNEITLSYRVRFVGNFDFVRSGKLAGICGGTCTSGGNPQDPNQEGWSWRDIWRRSGGGAAYLYYPGQSGQYGDEIGWSSGFPTNQWISLKTRIRLNTPGQNDGIVQTWKDGQLVLDKRDARIRQNASTGFDRFLLISFFGGATSDFAARKTEYVDFDDFVLVKP